MKKTLFLACLLTTTLGMNIASYAESMSSSSSPEVSSDRHDKHRPCMDIAIVCENAGFRLSKKVPGKNIWRDCVKPILAGQTVADVTVDPADVKACQEHTAAWKNKRMKNMHEKPVTAPTALDQE